MYIESFCNNKLTIVNNGGISYIFSYKSLIAIYYNNYLFLDSYYKNYSVTTNKHIAFIKDYYYINNDFFIILGSSLFDKLSDSNFNKESLKQIINLFVNNNIIIDYLKEYSNYYKYNKKEYLKNKKYINSLLNLKELISLHSSGGALSYERTYNNSYKTVNKIIDLYTINNISFKYERTYNNSNGALINIKIKDIRKDPIKNIDL